MFFQVVYTTALLSVFIVLANAAPATNTKCHTIASGYLSAYIGRASLAAFDWWKLTRFLVGDGHDEAFDLNSANELTFGKGKAIQAVFQVSATLGNECGSGTELFVFIGVP